MTTGQRKREKARLIEKKRLANVDNWTTKNHIAGSYSDKAFYRTPEWQHFSRGLIHGRRACECCGYRDRRFLRVSHIESRFMAPDKAFNKKNAVVLCKQCASDKPVAADTKPTGQVVILRRAKINVDTALSTPDNN